MAPIRVGIIGLSSVTTNKSASPGDGWAASAHLPYLIQSPHYEITALCNSSVESAEAAIKRHKLPPSTKAYGSPEDLAKDPNVDIVVCSVRVDRHYALTMPSLKTGKAVFVEWPLGSNLQQAEEMLAAAKQSGSKTIVGLQSRPSPFIQKVKELVETKHVGELVSSNLVYVSGTTAEVGPPGIDYLIKKKVGGNFLTIHFGHITDAALYALGGIKELSGQLSTRWSEMKYLNSDGSFNSVVKRETPDHIALQGTLNAADAPFNVTFRQGKAFPDTPKLAWHILGTKGEIRVTANAPISLALGGEKIEVHDHDTDKVDVIDVEYGAAVRDLSSPFAKNIGALYELYATGGSVGDGLVSFEEAVGMHKILDGIEKSSDGKKWETIKA
ncbi:NAD-P-binding protein [Paraphoma chrysanthemicola]|uniref:NAD-P-binding protein n=1 Tax=Paraphoma chrysanthemicola TaxID=798071 RepID=A0A8K0R5D7_9PLEO|nr:NAD-P-binding protein [Paraphoma chrysanthemicola]